MCQNLPKNVSVCTMQLRRVALPVAVTLCDSWVTLEDQISIQYPFQDTWILAPNHQQTRSQIPPFSSLGDRQSSTFLVELFNRRKEWYAFDFCYCLQKWFAMRFLASFEWSAFHFVFYTLKKLYKFLYLGVTTAGNLQSFYWLSMLEIYMSAILFLHLIVALQFLILN